MNLYQEIGMLAREDLKNRDYLKDLREAKFAEEETGPVLRMKFKVGQVGARVDIAGQTGAEIIRRLSYWLESPADHSLRQMDASN